MKKIVLLFILLIHLFGLQDIKAQLNIKASKEEAIEQFNTLKATTTVFFYKKSKAYSIDSIKQAITSAWDLTPIIFEDFSKADKYMSNPKYSFFSIEGNSFTRTSAALTSTSTQYYLVLRIHKGEDKRGNIITTPLCRIELFPNYETLKIVTGYDDSDDVIDKLYNRGIFYNWTPILLKAQFATISTELKNNERRWVFKNVKSSNFSEIIKNDTLYIPDYVLTSFNKYTGKAGEHDENIFSGYKYNFRVCNEIELFQIFEEEKRGRLLFEYVKSSSAKFVTIYDLKDKSIVYRRYSPMSYNVKKKDFEVIE